MKCLVVVVVEKGGECAAPTNGCSAWEDEEGRRCADDEGW